MRPLSDVERLWLAAERVAPPFVLNLVIEGPGEVSPEALQAAVQAARGASLRLTGHLGWSRWVQSAPPPVRALPSSSWTGCEPGPAWLDAPLPARVCAAEVLTGPGRVVFRAHHALMDGRGLLTWAREVFAHLRGDAPGLLDTRLTDRDAAVGVPAEKPVAETCGSPLGPASTPSLHTTWTRQHVPGRVSRLVPRLIHAVADEVTEGDVRIDVPVDLRPSLGTPRSTANLTGILRLGPADSVDATQSLLLAQVARGSAKRFVSGARWLRWWPVGLLGWLGRRGALERQAEGRYVASATVSSLGRLDRSAYSTDTFEAQRIAVIPPGQPGLPVLLTATGTDLGVDLCAAAPIALAGEGRLEQWLDRIIERLNER